MLAAKVSYVMPCWLSLWMESPWHLRLAELGREIWEEAMAGEYGRCWTTQLQRRNWDTEHDEESVEATQTLTKMDHSG